MFRQSLRLDAFFRSNLAVAGILAIGILSGCNSDKSPPPTSSGKGATTNSTAAAGVSTTTAVTPPTNGGAVPTTTATAQATTATTTAKPTPTATTVAQRQPAPAAAPPEHDVPENQTPDPDSIKIPAGKAGEQVPLNPKGTVLLDLTGKKVILKTNVALREGALELLCCKKQTKEHESIFTVDTPAYVVQTALLALGAKTGKPAQFEPKYEPASGERIDIFASWTDAQGKPHRRPARELVRYLSQRFYVARFPRLPPGIKLPEPSELRYDSVTQELSWYGRMQPEQRDKFLELTTDAEFRKAIQKFFDDSQPREMTAEFIFVGSGFQTRPDGKRVFLAEDGDLICVANFSNAVIDVNMKSSSVNETLLFEAYTERIPPKGTPVTLELVPVLTPPPDKK